MAGNEQLDGLERIILRVLPEGGRASYSGI